MVRIIDKPTRNREILSSIIENYIHTAEAVSSENICGRFDYSSATIRNIMLELENQGYLTHLHTSSGRVPTDKGYRYYVDLLLCQLQLVEKEKERIKKEYTIQLNKLEDIMEKTSEILSEYTRCAGIVSFLTNNRIYYSGTTYITEQPEFKNIEKIHSLLKILEQKSELLEILNRNIEKKINIYIGQELSCDEISGCSLIVTSYNIEKKPYGRIAVLGPRRMNYSQVIPFIEYLAQQLDKTLENI